MEWFKAGGFGMFVILIVGLASIAFGLIAAREPKSHRLAVLRPLPALIVGCALFTFGTDLWAVNYHLTSEIFLKTRDIGSAELPFIAVLGVTEAGQALTLGGLLASIVLALRIVAEARWVRRGAQAAA